MGETVEKPLFETRRHASRPYASNYPPQPQLKDGGGSGLLSYLPFRGITQLKEKWSEYRQPRRLRRLVSLFVSARGDYVAVAYGNQIAFLRKENDYQEPVGSFTCGSAGIFTCGTWSESHELLGVADDTGIIYIVKPNGEEMTRITKRHLNLSSPIIGLIAQDDSSEKKSYLCIFTVFASDGSFHDFEISKDPSASTSSSQALNNSAMLRQFPSEICCWDYHPELSLFAIVSSASDIKSTFNGSTGSYSISIWRRKQNLKMELVVLSKSEGSYCVTKGYHGQHTPPKLLFSPSGNFVASLDVEGCLFTFKFDKETSSFSSTGTEFLQEIVDFTWWSDGVLTVAKRNGTIIMINILNHVNVSENDISYSMPLLERAQQHPGLIFILENISSEDSYRSAEQKGVVDHLTVDRPNKFDFSKMEWSLVSLTKRSVLQLFDNLIRAQRFQAALEFADCHGLDRDEVLKSQWLSSAQGVRDINTILAAIKDQVFILSECVDKVGPTEDAMRALLSFGLRLTDCYRFSELEDNENEQIWNFRLTRLKLLQFRDKLETFIGINMGRFSMQEYSRFRDLPISKAAIVIAEGGKIGALNLLFKRHSYSLVPSMLEVLAAIPETIPVQSYGQLLPGTSAPSSIILRDEDWVECEKMVMFVRKFHGNHESTVHFITEPISMKFMSFQWPSISELSSWYKKRARDIDSLSGQLENSICLVDLAIQKGISELQDFLEDINYLFQLIYSDENEDGTNFSMSLSSWEQLSDYEKFKLLMMEVKEDNLIPRLHKKAVPFMRRRFNAFRGDDATVTQTKTVDSFLVRWLKEVAAENNLDFCLIVIEEGLRDMVNHHLFKDEMELVDCALKCIYVCSDVDRWNTMSTILSKLPQIRDVEAVDIRNKLKIAEGHVEAGRLLTYYQVPKPINFFVNSHLDDKGVKQILRLLLSKFIRWQPSRTDHDWANMWRDLQSLQEKAFPFLDLEFVLIEFCRGLLKAGKFSLARNYLKGTSSVTLATDKAENLVIQAAREYFFSAPTLTSPEIWKAKECLNIFRSSRNVRVEADTIDAVTVRLPNLGVNLLPMAFKQIKDPMEIIKLAITSQSGAYLNVDELIEIAKLLGLNSQEEISKVQEAIAREAAYTGDIQLASDVCLVLAKKGHGSIWDLCAAIARSQALESMDTKSKKLLLGFALSHCDEESIGELLQEWKDLDLQDQCENLSTLTGTEPSKFSEQRPHISFGNEEPQFANLKSLLTLVVQNLSSENGYDWEYVLKENSKVVSFASSHLPWLLKLCKDEELGKSLTSDSVNGIQHVSLRARAVMTVLSWLTRSGFTPKDDLVSSLARSIMEPPVSDGEDVIGCSVLLNLIDAFHGAEIIEEQLNIRENYNEFSSLMNAGMIYSFLHSYGVECKDPAQRREALINTLQNKPKKLSSDECTKVHEAQSTFWNEWKVKLEQQKNVADESRILERLIPGVETSRFFSGDMDYIQTVIFSLIESLKTEKKQIMKDVLILAHTYGLERSKVLLYYLRTILVSEVWSVDDIAVEVSEYREDILTYAAEVVISISLSVYPEIEGHDKQRLAFIYNLLSECYNHLEESKELPAEIDQHLLQRSVLELATFCKIAAQECLRVSFIESLNFKNIALLQSLNSDFFNDEVCAHINENNVEALAEMVQNLVHMYGNAIPEGLLSYKSVHSLYVTSSLATLEEKAEREMNFQTSEEINSFIDEMEQLFYTCKKHIRFIEHPAISDTLRRFFTIILPIKKSFPRGTIGIECPIKLINFWLRLMNEFEDLVSPETLTERFYSECSITCLEVFLDLLVKDIVSPSQGWCTVVNYVAYGLENSFALETLYFCRAMIFSGCGFEAISLLFSAVAEKLPTATAGDSSLSIHNLSKLYLTILESLLQDIARERHSLHYLLSSLGKMEGDFGELKKVRLAVWDRMSMLCDDLELPSHMRVYFLELLQFLSGKKGNLESFSLEGESYLQAWEGCDDLHDRTPTCEDISAKDKPSRFTSTLVALKSSQLVSSISPTLEITPDNIHSVDSAVSCFLKLSESATSASHIDSLLAVLAEWEGLFTAKTDEEASIDASDGTNNWGNDDWDEGWESFQEESVERETKENKPLSIHHLHICWLTLITKMATLSSQRDVLKLLDQNVGKNCGILLDEEDSRILTQTVTEMDCFFALKVTLLLPYESIQFQCLDAVENKLKEGGIPDETAKDHFFLALLLSSGILSSIITKASYGTIFSFLCFIVGNFCRHLHEASTSKPAATAQGESLDFLFVKLILPCFVGELVKADQSVLAGFLVTRLVNTNASVSLINIAEASLRAYLERELVQVEENESWERSGCFVEPLSNTLRSFKGKLGDSIRSALSTLPTDVR